ncbi:hypothetical protein AMEX_G8764 [Astyanax mexicanus]|uniref:Uncharacterized protein n=1 Tax=Astyanax mexicanus TaxID=7994 RepID=A0A8T2LYG1_ASTMX|nr:hypothetical protein AMEX_G8764 [Astyanax mexicanus]
MHSELMASQADISKGSDGSNKQTELTEMQHQNDLKALNDKLAVMEEKMALCNAVLDDLRSIQRIVQEKGLCDSAFQGLDK